MNAGSTGSASKEQIAELDAVLDRLAERGARRPTLWGLIEAWRATVEQVESGYDRSLHEYFNDLGPRRALEEVVREAPTIATWVAAEIAPLDQRFREATLEAGGGSLLSRVPRSPGPELAQDLDDPRRTTFLFRPVGDDELALIEASGFRRFPPRLPEQPIFYPVLTREYAERIAGEWNARDGRRGHVTRFAVKTSFLTRYPIHEVGGERLRELWVPAEELDEFCDQIEGQIEVVATFEKGDRSRG